MNQVRGTSIYLRRPGPLESKRNDWWRDNERLSVQVSTFCQFFNNFWVKMTPKIPENDPKMTRKWPENDYLINFWGWLEPYYDDMNIDHEFWN